MKEILYIKYTYTIIDDQKVPTADLAYHKAQCVGTYDDDC